MNSPERPTEPTVMVGTPVTFLAQPAKFRSLPSNSGSQNRRCEQWMASAPASTRAPSQVSSVFGSWASFTLKSCCFHWLTRMITG